jgi:protoporphyrin/coproporphyrin ferrochelatase
VKLGLAVLDFGGPTGPDELVPFLTALLEDVLPGPMAIKRLVAPTIARRRSVAVGPNYEMIGWSPLVATHQAQVAALKAALGDDAPVMASGMMFTPPSMRACVDELLGQGVEGIIALPMFPHYSIATTQAAFSFFWDALVEAGGAQLPVRWIPGYFDHPLYIRSLASTIRAGVAAMTGDDAEPIHLLFTPHGLPVSWVTKRGDPYPDQIRASVRAVIQELNWEGPWSMGWQSRVGPVQWLVPGTDTVLQDLGKAGAKRVCMVPISFASEHIETLHEIDIEYAEIAHKAGITHYGRAPALGTDADFIAALADRVRDAMRSRPKMPCVRCLQPKDEAWRKRGACVNCLFSMPAYLEHSRPFAE